MVNLIERIFYKGSKSIKRCIAMVLCAVVVVTGNFGTVAFANEISENEPDIYAQKFVENIDIEGVNYTYKYYYNENGERSISITDMTSSKTEILTYDQKTSNIYLDDEKMGNVKTSDDKDQDAKAFGVDTSWKLIGGPSHEYVSWAKGTSAAIVAGAIAIVLGFKTDLIITAVGFGSLSILAASCNGATVHFSLYYRDLALGQYQNKTDWSFVASTGDRYGTYTYLSTPQSF